MKLSNFLWALSILLALLGFAIATAGVYLGVALASPVGLYLVVIGPLIVGLAGIVATSASKFEAEGR